MRKAGAHGRAAAARDAVREFESACRSGHLERERHATAGQVADLLGGLRVRGVHGRGRAELTRDRQLRFVHVDGDDVRGLEHARGEQRGEAHAAEADHCDRRATRHRGRVHHGADAGDDRAAEKRGFGERQVGGHAHQRVRGKHRVIRESRHAEVVMHVALRVVQPSRARQQRAGAVGRESRLAERRPARGAGSAVAATRHERRDDVVATGEARHAFADLLDDARRLVPEDHRQRTRPVAVDHRQVGMAEPRCANAHQHFAGAWRVEFDFLERERLRLLVGWRAADLAEHGGFDFHAREHTAGRALFLSCAAGGTGRVGETRRKYVRVGSHAASMPRDGFADPTGPSGCAGQAGASAIWPYARGTMRSWDESTAVPGASEETGRASDLTVHPAWGRGSRDRHAAWTPTRAGDIHLFAATNRRTTTR